MDELQPTDPPRIGRYRLTARLGAGGMGRVYLGRSPSGRLVAVKVVRPDLAEDPGFRDRFVREVAAARKVTGFFTAAVVDADPEGSPPWLATAYVPGMALDKAVAAHGPWPVDSVRTLGAGVAEALEAIHEAGLVHRDLKPANVLIAPDGPRVVDFGISVAIEATALTRTGMIVGTPGFMAPEQLVGKPVTPATDVFALGAMLTYAATGTGPFGTGSAQSLNFRIVYEEPDLAGLPSPGLEIIARCLAKDPNQRPKVADLIEELAPATADHDYTPTEVGPENVSWLPAPVAGALPATVTAPAATVPPTPPAPTAPPAPAMPPPVALPPPVAVAQPSASRHRAFPFWIAVAALVLSLVLPFGDFGDGYVVLAEMDVGTHWKSSYFAWQLMAVAVSSACACGAVLAMLRRAPSAPVPRWARNAHILTTTLTTALFAEWAFYDVGVRGPAAWSLALGCAALIYSTSRFPAPKHPSAAVVVPAAALHRALPYRITVTALALSVFLYVLDSEVVLDYGRIFFNESQGIAYAAVLSSVATLLSVCAGAAAVSSLRRAAAPPVQHRARSVHILTTALTTALFALSLSFYVYYLERLLFSYRYMEGSVYLSTPAPWSLALGCTVLIYSALRVLPAPTHHAAP
ncbi:serine/threonine-protein kinase [Streptomyces litchfieldiae]|uniref:Serine/threonine-protein kinase n=1 Tax=Streptomyces litchfieldiae TaxID=3075543 RepID=A0ABU2MJF5_9ACTN|nr:serine/threonine-protein kinase [Streptomyces sp. DSM 44938]MDT0341737.1 serine/threonine-protein kinase [Streptomyces sp. DSM 44938]